MAAHGVCPSVRRSQGRLTLRGSIESAHVVVENSETADVTHDGFEVGFDQHTSHFEAARSRRCYYYSCRYLSATLARIMRAFSS